MTIELMYSDPHYVNNTSCLLSGMATENNITCKIVKKEMEFVKG